MKFWKCDRCGKQATPEEGGADYVKDWETVTVSTSFHYGICDTCSPLLFKFLTSMQEAAKP
jgi:hypothetical protein